MYVDPAGLARYKSDFDAWARGRLLPRDAAAARVRTAKAGAVSFVPVQETPLDVSVDFLFSETPPAEGDKSPSNPSTITGVSSVNVGRIGKNQLLKISSFNWAGLDVTANADGSYTFNGTATLSAFSARAFTDSAATYGGAKSSVHLDNTKNYTISCELVSGSVSLSDPDGTKPGFVYGYADTNAASARVPLPLSVGKNSIFSQAKVNSSGEFIARVQQFQSATFTNAVYRFQLEEGSTATDFEAPMLPADANNTIPLGSTYYGGTLDAVSGVMTVTWVAVELNGTETWDAISSYNSTTGIGLARCYPENIGLRKKAALDVTLNSACTHFSYLGNFGGTSISDGTVTTPRFFYTNGTASINGQARFAVPFSDVADFKAWLATQKTAGTPVMLTYKIYEPFTVTLTPTEILSLAQPDKYTPRLNTVYTDAQAVQVGYLKHPSAVSADLRNALVSLGGGV